MSKRGVLELQTPSGFIEVEVGDPAVLPYTPIEVLTPSGWAAPRVVDPSEADTPLEVKTASGWKGIARRVFRLIDSFEDHDMGEYHSVSASFSIVHDIDKATHKEHALQSNFGTGGNDACWSSTGLSNYPSRGDTFKSNHRIHHPANGAGVQFGCEGDGSNIYPDGYSARINHGNSGKFQLVHQDPNGGQGGEYVIDEALIDTSAFNNAEHLEIEVSFGSPTITATLYDTTGSQVTTISGDDSDFTGSGFGWISTIDASTGSDQYVWHDFGRITG